MKLYLLVFIYIIYIIESNRPKAKSPNKRKEIREMSFKNKPKNNKKLPKKLNKLIYKTIKKNIKKNTEKAKNYKKHYNQITAKIVDPFNQYRLGEAKSPRHLDKLNITLEESTEEERTFRYCDHGKTPDVKDDCTKHQTEESSCCYFAYGNQIGCVYLGIRYLGSTDYGGLTLYCDSNLALIKFHILLIFMLIILS